MTYYYEAKDGREVQLEIGYEISNHGIGYYEYGSQKCYDKGTDEPEDFFIEDIADEDLDLKLEIEEWMASDDGQTKLIEAAYRDMEKRRDDAAEHRYELERDSGEIFG